jgi:hypothetical protein
VIGRLTFFALILTACQMSSAQQPAALINSAHGGDQLVTDIDLLKGSGYAGTSVAVDRTTASPSDVTFDSNIIADAVNTGRSNYSQVTSDEENNAPYSVLNNSFSGFSLSGWEFPNYAFLDENQVEDSWAYTLIAPSGTPPPTVSTTITGVESNFTGPGIEFGMSHDYEGFDTSAPSWVTAGLSAILLAMRADHPGFKWGDIIGALRQTAGNWASGYNPSNWGYGTIDYVDATAITSTANIYLQPPILMASSPSANEITLTIYPFRSTRRAYEVVYLVRVGYAWPVKNEYTTSDIAASGGTLIYTSNGTDEIPSATVSFSVAPGNYDLLGFTSDGAGHFSRYESFLPTPISGACL